MFSFEGLEPCVLILLLLPVISRAYWADFGLSLHLGICSFAIALSYVVGVHDFPLCALGYLGFSRICVLLALLLFLFLLMPITSYACFSYSLRVTTAQNFTSIPLLRILRYFCLKFYIILLFQCLCMCAICMIVCGGLEGRVSFGFVSGFVPCSVS